jgi:hypothetical protein
MPMSSPGSVSRWLVQLKAGDEDGAQALWQLYFQRLVAMARKKLQGRRLGLADQEDVALSAFNSFCRGAEQGRFPRLADREDLWQILIMLTARKAWALLQHQGRQKRGGGAQPADVDVQQIIGAEPTPEFAVQVAHQSATCSRRSFLPRISSSY